MADELQTHVNITGSESASQPIQNVSRAGDEAVGSMGRLGQAMHEMQQASRQGIDSLAAFRSGLQQLNQASQQTAQSMQQAHRQMQGQTAGGGASGIQQMTQHLIGLRTAGQQTASTFSTIGSALTTPFRALGGALGSAQSAVQGLGNSLVGAFNPLLQGAGFALATAGINGLAGAMQAVVGAGIGFNSQLQLANIAFSNFTGSASLAQEEIRQLQILAANTPFEFQDVLTGARRFGSLGIEAGKVVQILKDLGVVGSSFGLDPNQFNRVTLAIQQVGVKGRLTGEELRQMGNDGFQAMRILAATTGKSMSEIQAAIEAGQVSAADFFKAIHDYAQRPELQKLAQEINQSFAVQASNLHDILQDLTANSIRPFFTGLTGFTGGLAATLQTPAFHKFSDDIAATIGDLGSKLVPLQGQFDAAFGFFEKGDVGRGAQTALHGITDAIAVLSGEMFGAGENLMGELAGGLLSGATTAIKGAAEFAAQLVANVLVGHSPPPEGPLANIGDGGRATAQEWIRGFESADFGAVATGQAVAVRNALGQASGALSLESGRIALQQAGSDMDRLRSVAEAATGASRTLSDQLRDNQSAASALAKEADGVKRGFEDQLRPLERSLQALRDQGNEENKLYDLERRRRDLTLSAEEKAAQGDPIRRAELQNADERLAQQEKALQLKEREMSLDAADATGSKKEQADRRQADIRRQILGIDVQRQKIQAEMDGLVDREAVARLRVRKAQNDQADAQHDIQKLQDDIAKSTEENNLEKQIHGLKNAQEEANEPLEARRKILGDERQSLQEQSQLFGQLKTDANELLSVQRQQEAERKAAVVQAKKDAKAESGDRPIGEGIPGIDLEETAKNAGKRVGESLLTGMREKMQEVGPAIIGAGIGAAIGGATFGPLGVPIGALFGAEFVGAVKEKVPEAGTIISDALRTAVQAWRGDWRPDGVDENGQAVWINPFVTNVGNMTLSIKGFTTSIQNAALVVGQYLKSPEAFSTSDHATQNLKDLNEQWGILLGKFSGGQGPAIQISSSAQAIEDWNRQTEEMSGAAANVFDLLNTMGEAFSAFGTGLSNQIEAQRRLLSGDVFGAIDAQQAAAEAFAKIPGLLIAERERAIARTTAQAPALENQARDDWSSYIKGVQLALEPLGPTLDEVSANVNVHEAAIVAALGSSATDFQKAEAVSRGYAIATDENFGLAAASAERDAPKLPAAVDAQREAMQAASTSLGSDLSKNWAAGVDETTDYAVKALPGIPDAVKAQNASMYSNSELLGDQLHSGLTAGVDKGKPASQKNIVDWFGDLINAVKGRLGISSPSAEFASIGSDMWAGLSAGFLASLQSGESALISSVQGLAERIKSAFGGIFGGGGGNRGGPINGEGPDAARQAASMFGIDPDFFTRQINAENNFRTDLSPNSAGARGIAQFMPGTATEAARMLGVTTEEFWADWTLQLKGAAALMRQYLDKYGNWADALTAYNAGPGRVGNAPAETIDYIQYVTQSRPGGPGAPSAASAPAGGFLPINLGRSQAAGVLDHQTAITRCGPYAAQLFAQAVGRNPTAEEADKLARGFGWVPGEGMTSAARWPDMAQALIDSQGGGGQVQNVGRGGAAAAAMTGAPVAFSTAKHYFVSQGFNPDTQQFHVGATGTFAGGQEWMTAEEISNIGQGIIAVYSEVKTAAVGASQAQATLGQASRIASQNIQQTVAPTQRFVTVLDGIYDNVANGRETLDVLQTQLIGIASQAGQEGAAGELMAMANGTRTAAQALQNVATVAARTNPAMAALAANYEAVGGAAAASEEDTAKFALDILNVYKASQGQVLEISQRAGAFAASGARAISGSGASRIAAPITAVNDQIQVGVDRLPNLKTGWEQAKAAEEQYAGVDLQPGRIDEQINKSGELREAWNRSTDSVRDYINALHDAAEAEGDVEGSHLEGAREIKRTGMYRLHEGEEVLTRGQVRRDSYAPLETRPDARSGLSGPSYIDRRTINLTAIDPRNMMADYARHEARLRRLRLRSRVP